MSKTPTEFSLISVHFGYCQSLVRDDGRVALLVFLVEVCWHRRRLYQQLRLGFETPARRSEYSALQDPAKGNDRPQADTSL